MLPTAANAADTVIRTEKLHSSANLSYKVAGKRYTPLTKVSSFSQTGKASWYGNQFHGRKTASGERYDMNALTAAHRTLPIPSYARVTNTKNGKSVIVRVNDRGPFHGSRVMDVSKAAAQKLGFISQGTTHIKIEQVLPGSEIAMSDMPKKDIYVDLKSFGSESEALAYMSQTGRNLSSADMASKVSVEKRGGSYVVRMGPFAAQERVDEAESRARMVVQNAI
ncbi:TPA: septal ring lytic transglycosylase RlpA family protein [Neisseria oralis]